LPGFFSSLFVFGKNFFAASPPRIRRADVPPVVLQPRGPLKPASHGFSPASIYLPSPFLLPGFFGTFSSLPFRTLCLGEHTLVLSVPSRNSRAAFFVQLEESLKVHGKEPRFLELLLFLFFSPFPGRDSTPPAQESTTGSCYCLSAETDLCCPLFDIPPVFRQLRTIRRDVSPFRCTFLLTRQPPAMEASRTPFFSLG